MQTNKNTNLNVTTMNSTDLVNYFTTQINNARTNPISVLTHLQQRRFISPQ